MGLSHAHSMSDIKTLNVRFGEHTTKVALGFYYTGWALVLAQQPDYESSNPLHATALTTRLSNNSPDLPFPPPNPQNSRWRFCMKTYSENEGVLQQLIAVGVLQTTSRDLQSGPLVEVLLEQTQISYCCLQCVNNDGPAGVQFEVPGEARLMRCSQCKIARYCNVEVG